MSLQPSDNWPGNLPMPEEEKNKEALRVCSVIVREMMFPLVESISKLLTNNTEALEQLASAQKIQNDRLEALEKQIRLNTPVTDKQVRYLNDAIRARARVLLDKQGIDDKRATAKLGNTIRKTVLSRYGAASLREIPRHEYSVAQDQISMWLDVLAIRDVVKEAKERANRQAEMDG